MRGSLWEVLHGFLLSISHWKVCTNWSKQSNQSCNPPHWGQHIAFSTLHSPRCIRHVAFGSIETFEMKRQVNQLAKTNVKDGSLSSNWHRWQQLIIREAKKSFSVHIGRSRRELLIEKSVWRAVQRTNQSVQRTDQSVQRLFIEVKTFRLFGGVKAFRETCNLEIFRVLDAYRLEPLTGAGCPALSKSLDSKVSNIMEYGVLLPFDRAAAVFAAIWIDEIEEAAFRLVLFTCRSNYRSELLKDG